MKATYAQNILRGSGAFRYWLVPKDSAAEYRVECQCTLAVCQGIGGNRISQLGNEEEVGFISGDQEGAVARARSRWGFERGGFREEAGLVIYAEDAKEVGA
jgi:hypothetical protein